MNLKKIFLIIFPFFCFFSVLAEETELKNRNTEYNVYTGMFDFSDEGQRSQLFGIQHQNSNLYRNTPLGEMSPVTGAMITADMKVCDLGCGTGAIALGIANTCGVGVLAVDKSDQAIRLTEKNADRLGLKHLVQTYLGSWHDKPEIGQFNVVVSNPPYIARGDSEVWDSVDQHEPHSALYAEDSGLLDIKVIIDYAKSILLPSGIIAIEHGKDQQDEVINLLEDQGFQLLYARKVANLPRYVIARY